MTTRIEEFVAHLGWEVDDKDLKEFDKQVKGITDTFKKVTLAIGAATSALTAAVIATNKQTAEFDNLAKSVGVSTDFLLAMGGVVKNVGFDFENVIDLVEEMNNKIGEKAGLGKMTAVEEAVKLLKIDFKDIKDLAPEKQFVKLLDAAKGMHDQQKAVSAIDMLMGGEGNRIVGFLRTIDGTLEEIIGKRLELNFLSKEGIGLASEFNSTWGLVSSSVSSMWAEFSGFLGRALKPILDDFSAWALQNRKLIKERLPQWAEKVGKALRFLVKQIKDLSIFVKRVTDSVGGLQNTLLLLGLLAGSSGIFKIAKGIGKIAPAFKAAAQTGKLFGNALEALQIPGAILSIAALVLALQDLKTWFQGGDTLFGKWGEDLADFLSDATDDLDEFFGLQRGQLRLWLSQFVDFHVKAYTDLFNLIVDASKEFLKNFSSVEKALKFIRKTTQFITLGATQPVIKPLIDRLLGAPSAKGFADQQRLKQIAGALDTAAKQAGPASLGGGSLTEREAIASTIAGPLGSPATQAPPNVQRGDTNIDIRNEYRISQRPGESGEDFAQRVTRVMEEQMANAVRTNDTGIER